MTHVTERTERTAVRRPDAPPRAAARKTPETGGIALAVLGALSLLVMGAVHLQQYFAVHYRVVPVIGPLFVLNFAGAVVIALLILPIGRNRVLGSLLALGGIGMAVVSFAFLFVSEHRRLFGFEEYGYRPAIIAALAAEAAATAFLGGYLARRPTCLSAEGFCRRAHVRRGVALSSRRISGAASPT